MGQQVSRSLAKTLPVLYFEPTGCLGEVVSHHNLSRFIQQHYSRCGPSFTFYSNDMKKIQSDVPLSYTGCIFHNHFCTISHVLHVYSSVCGPTDQPGKCYNLISLIIEKLPLLPALWQSGLFITSFCPCLTDWYSLQCHSHLRPIFVISL